MSAEDCVTSGMELLSLQSRWHPTVADRCTQMVWIGAQMDEATICAALDQCCMTEEEMAAALPTEDDEEDDEEEEEDEGQVKAKKQVLLGEQLTQWSLLSKVLSFDADPNAEPTCALRA